LILARWLSKVYNICMKTRKIIALVFVLLGLSIAGSLLVECGALELEEKPYFYDRIGELMLIGRRKDVYVERLDTGESRKVTNTPDMRELDAFFGQGGSVIIYKAEEKKSAFDKKSSYEFNLFMQPTDMNDLKKVEIDYFLYRDLKQERLKQRDHAQ
ncbi:MAG: hypothetical protein ABH875_06120, partial [Candidatus Omnitrophota bacterium]